MKSRFAFLCEYATTRSGPTTAVAILDTVQVRRAAPEAPLAIGLYFIVASFECTSAEGPRHLMTFRLKDEDGKTIFEHETPFELGRTQETAPLSGQIVCGVTPMNLANDGQFTWAVLVDGLLYEEIPFTVVELAQPAPAV